MPGIVGFHADDKWPQNKEAILLKMRDSLCAYANVNVFPAYSKENFFVSGVSVGDSPKNDLVISVGNYQVIVDGEILSYAGFNGGLITFQLKDFANRLIGAFESGNMIPFLRSIDGIFACVIYNSARKSLDLICDRYGLQYLFWLNHGASMIFSSEFKTFRHTADYSITINEKAVAEFLTQGHFLGDTTWDKRINLLKPGTWLHWDSAGNTSTEQQYWDLNSDISYKIPHSRRHAAKKIYKLFQASVEKRMGDNPKIGISLSSGLDSRAILAAMMKVNHPPEAVFTFGREGSIDLAYSGALSRLANVPQIRNVITDENWSQDRILGIWITDGMLDYYNMQYARITTQLGARCTVNMNGFLGDATAGGTYIKSAFANERETILQRGRRFIRLGVRLGEPYVKERIPFFDNDLLSFILSLPTDLREHSSIYNQALLRYYPKYFAIIPYDETCRPLWAKKTRHENLFTEYYNKVARIPHKLIGGIRMQFRPQDPKTQVMQIEKFLNNHCLQRDFGAGEKLDSLMEGNSFSIQDLEIFSRHFTIEVWLNLLLGQMSIEDIEKEMA